MYEPANPLTWEEFQPKPDKQIEEEAKAIIKRYSLEAHVDMEEGVKPAKKERTMETWVRELLSLATPEQVKEYDQSNNKVERMLLGIDFAQHVNHKIMEIGKFHHMQVFKPLAVAREHRTAPQVAELQEESEEVASIPHGDFKLDRPVLLGCDWGRAHKGFVAIGKQVLKQWRGKL